MSPPRPTVAAYARGIERALASARGAPVVVSERDFALLRNWHARGVPLAVVLDALRGVQARGKVPRSLAYVAPAVEEAWRALADAAPTDTPNPAPPVGGSIEGTWRSCRDALETGSALRAVVERVLERVVRGEEPSRVDADVDAELPAAAPHELVAACEAATRRALTGHRDRMAPDVFERTHRRALASRLRDALGWPASRAGA